MVSEGGAEVVDLARIERPDVILMDYVMLEIDGAEQVRRLQDVPELAATPVIFLTGEERPADLARLDRLGVRGMIEKPFDPAALAGEFERLLHRSSDRS